MAVFNAEVEIEKLRKEIADVRRQLPPDGWRAVNFHFIEDPSYSIVIDTATRHWSVWRGGEFVCAAPTIEECVRKFRAERHVR